jgi:hypothetical protein
MNYKVIQKRGIKNNKKSRERERDKLNQFKNCVTYASKISEDN